MVQRFICKCDSQTPPYQAATEGGTYTCDQWELTLYTQSIEFKTNYSKMYVHYSGFLNILRFSKCKGNE